MKKVILTIFCLQCVLSPAYAQIPGLTEAILGGVIGGVVAQSATRPASPHGPAWSQDIYASHMTDALRNGRNSVSTEDKRIFSTTAKSIIWLGESLYLVSPRPVKAVWLSPKGKFAETKVARYKNDIYRATLLNKKNGFAGLEGRWEVRILTATGQAVDTQHFYVGHAHMEEESKAAQVAAQAMDLSKEDAVVVFSRREVVILGQYGSVERYTKRIKLLSDRGKEFVEVFMPFASGVEHVSVNYAYTIKPNGDVVDAKEYGVRTYAKSYPDYSAFQFFNMTLPSLEKGCIVEYQILTSTPSPKAEGMFFDTFSPQGQLPMFNATYTLNVDKGTNIKYNELNIKVNVKEEDSTEGRKIYRFSAGPLLGIKIEPAMPSPRDVVGEVIIATVKSWDDIARWWANLIRNKSEVTKDIQTYVDELLKGATGSDDKIHRIYADVSKSVRYVGLNFGSNVYEPADAAEVFKNKYGDCKDQSMLLLAMLKAGGIKAHTVLAKSGYGEKVQKDTPTLNEFNHVIVAAEAGSKTYFLDPTLKQYPFGVLPPWWENRYVMHIKDGVATFEFLPLSPPASNRSVTNIELSMDSNFNFSGALSVTWSLGQSGDMRQFLYQLNSNKQKEEMVDQILKGIYPYAVRDSYKFLDEDNVDKPLSLQVAFHMENWLIDAGKGSFLLHMYGAEVKTPDYLAKNRAYPATLDFLSSQAVHVTLRLPKGYEAELPETFDIKTNHMENHVHYTLKDGLLRLDQELSNLSVEVPVGKIDSVRSAWEKIAQANRRGVLLKKQM